MKEFRAQNVTCNGCGIKGHLKKCCKKSGNFPKDSSNRQNQSSSTDPSRMNIASTLPQTEADFFDEKGLLKEYRPPVQQQYKYKARHAHKRLYTVLPKYSKIQVLPGITSCRLVKDNKQAIELNSLLINNMPEGGYG